MEQVMPEKDKSATKVKSWVEALEDCDGDAVQYLLDQGEPINGVAATTYQRPYYTSPTPYKDLSPLTIALMLLSNKSEYRNYYRNEDLAMIKMLLNAGADPNIRLKYKEKAGSFHSGPEIDPKFERSLTPFWWLLMEIVYPTKNHGRPRYSDEELLDLLKVMLDKGADVNSECFPGNSSHSIQAQTPLQFALEHNAWNLAQLLLSRGADPHKLALNNPATPLSYIFGFNRTNDKILTISDELPSNVVDFITEFIKQGISLKNKDWKIPENTPENYISYFNTIERSLDFLKVSDDVSEEFIKSVFGPRAKLQIDALQYNSQYPMEMIVIMATKAISGEMLDIFDITDEKAMELAKTLVADIRATKASNAATEKGYTNLSPLARLKENLYIGIITQLRSDNGKLDTKVRSAFEQAFSQVLNAKAQGPSFFNKENRLLIYAAAKANLLGTASAINEMPPESLENIFKDMLLSPERTDKSVPSHRSPKPKS